MPRIILMSVILVSPTGADIQVNMWHWPEPTMFLVRLALQLDDERFEMLQLNGVGAAVSAFEAGKIATFLDDYLAEFPKDGRLLPDGLVTREPKGSQVFRTVMGTRTIQQATTGSCVSVISAGAAADLRWYELPCVTHRLQSDFKLIRYLCETRVDTVWRKSLNHATSLCNQFISRGLITPF